MKIRPTERGRLNIAFAESSRHNGVSERVGDSRDLPTLTLDKVKIEQAYQSRLDKPVPGGGGLKMLGGLGLLLGSVALAGAGFFAAGPLGLVGGVTLSFLAAEEAFRMMGRGLSEAGGPPGEEAAREALTCAREAGQIDAGPADFLPSDTVLGLSDLPRYQNFKHRDSRVALLADGEVDYRFRQDNWNFVSGISDSRLQSFLSEGTAPGPEWRPIDGGGFRSPHQELMRAENSLELRTDGPYDQKHILRVKGCTQDGRLDPESMTESFFVKNPRGAL